MARVIAEWRYYQDETTGLLASLWKNYNADGEDLSTTYTLEYYLNNSYSILGQSSQPDPNGANMVTWTLSNQD